MHIRLSNAATVGAVILWLTQMAVAGPSSTLEELTKGKAAYQQKLNDFKQECNTAKTEQFVRYRKTLEALRKAVKEKGDFDGVLVVDEEIKRFEKQDRQLPSTPSASPDLAKAIKLCREALEKADRDSAQKVIDCTDRYLQSLDQRVRQATREDKLELAKAFDTELKAARETPEYQAARFLIADKSDAEVAKKEAAEPSPTTADKAPVATATNPASSFVLGQPRVGRYGEKQQPRIDPKGLYDAESVFEGSPTATLGTPKSYRPLAVIETGKAPLSGGVGVAMEGSLDTDASKYQLRIKLRTKSTSTSFVNLKVMAMYFFKNPNTTAMQEANTYHITVIPSLGAKSITCEFKPMDLPYASSYRYRGGRYVEDRDGTGAGVIVSVFSPDDKLLAQVTSANPIKDKGKTAFDLPDTWMERVWRSQPEALPFAVKHRKAVPANDN